MIPATPMLKNSNGIYVITKTLFLLKQDVTKLYNDPPLYDDEIIDYLIQFENLSGESEFDEVRIRTTQTDQLERDYQEAFAVVESLNDEDLLFQPYWENVKHYFIHHCGQITIRRKFDLYE